MSAMLSRLRLRHLVGLTCTVAVPLALTSACKKDAEAKFGGEDTNPSATATAPPPPPPTDAGVAQPEAAPPVDAAAAMPAAQPLDPLTQEALLKELTKRKPKEMGWQLKALGGPFGGILQEGGVVEQTIMINSGKCYGVIAQSSGAITELDVQILALPPQGIPLPLPSTTYAVDSTAGPQAAVSPCVQNVWPMSFQAKVIVKATRGSGPVLAQVYLK